MLTSRQKLILKAIIELYVKDAQPVGSKALTQLPYLNFSSATLRYDMAQLEELGYLEKTHTSSGRIPSELGYRYYVEHLVTRDQDVLESFPLIDEIFLKNKMAREKTIEEAINLLSELTNYAALAVGPSGQSAKIKKIDFIPLSEDEAVILIVTDQGHVQHQSITIPEDGDIEGVRKVIKTLDDLLKNRNIIEASEILKNAFAKSQIESFMAYQEQIIDSFIDAFSKFAEENFYLSGVTNIFEQPEFHSAAHIKNFVDMLDRRELLKFIGQEDGLSIRFGSDLRLIPMENCTVISVPYRINEEEHGTIAVVGPTRMQYNKVIPLVEYIASNLGKLYKK
ncbi:heat-inducible transcription repressor HrcA [Tenericutes bacterium MO-XQ]|nr:heat-inducible transcription repressor HrcA [Tenericutes bacterium MO-XQ]